MSDSHHTLPDYGSQSTSDADWFSTYHQQSFSAHHQQPLSVLHQQTISQYPPTSASDDRVAELLEMSSACSSFDQYDHVYERYNSALQQNLELLSVLRHVPSIQCDPMSTYSLWEAPPNGGSGLPDSPIRRPCMMTSQGGSGADRTYCAEAGTVGVNGRETTSRKGSKYQCPVCSYTSKKPCDVRRHLSTHDKPKKPAAVKYHYCGICSFRTRRSLDLKRHVLAHKGYKYDCPICGKQYSSVSSVNAHLKSHQGDGLPHKCRFCGDGFLHLSSLIKHERIHTGEKPFLCPCCSETFAQKCNLNRHRIRFRH